MPPRPVPFSEPSEGWWRWNSSHANSKQLEDLLKSDKLIGLAALDIQIKYPQFQKYKPENFSKNLSRVKQELGLREAAAGAPDTPSVLATAVNAPNDSAMAFDPPRTSTRLSTFAFESSTDFPDGVMEMRLPCSLEELFDGKFRRVSVQIHLLTGLPIGWQIDEDGHVLVGRMLMSRNFTDPAKAFGKFQLPDGRHRYPS